MAGSNGEPITLYDSGTCPYAQRAWIALVEKELPFNHRIVDLANKPEDFVQLYAEINPDPEARAKVPILIDSDGSRVIESNIVAEYLEDKYPAAGTRLLPEDPVERAKVRMFMQTFADLVGPSVFGLLRADTTEALEQGKAKFVTALQVLDKFLRQHGSESGGSFLLGARYSMAEVCSTPFVRRALVVLPVLRDFDAMEVCREQGLGRLQRWMQASIERPSATSTGPDDASMVDSMKKFLVPIKA